MHSTRQQTPRPSTAAPGRRSQPAARRPGDAPGSPGQAKMPPRKMWLWFVLVLFANYVLMRLLMPGSEAPVTVPYTVFKEEVRKGNVKAIFSRGKIIRGRFATPVTYPPADEQRAAPGGESGAASRDLPTTATTFTTTLPAFVGPGLETFLIEHHVEISAKPIQETTASGRRSCSDLARPCSSSAFTSGCFGGQRSRAAWGAGSWALAGAGHAATTRSRKQRSRSMTSQALTKPRTNWSRSWIFSETRRNTPVWAAGAEGRAAGGRAGDRQDAAGAGGGWRGGGAVLLDERLGVRGDDRGGGGARVRDLFAQAKRRPRRSSSSTSWTPSGAPGAGGLRGGERAGADPEPDLDGDGRLSSREGVIVVAATNRPDVLDRRCCGRGVSTGAWWCSCRTGRAGGIFRVHTRGVPLARDVTLAALAAATPGLSGRSCATWSTRRRCWPPGASRRGAATRTSSRRWRRSCSAARASW